MRTAKSRRPVSAALLLALLFCTAGCFDYRDVEHRAIVLAVGIDQAEGGAGYAVSFQIAVPGKIGGGEGSGGGEATFNITETGGSLAEAIHKAQYQTALPLFFGHVRLVAVSDGVAASGLSAILDYFRRNSEIRRTAWLVIGKPNAAAVLEAKPKLEQVPTIGLLDIIETHAALRHIATAALSEFWSRLDCPAEEPVVPVLTATDGAADFTGTAAFRGDRMVGEYTSEETAYLLILLAREGLTDVTVANPQTGAQMTVTLTNVKTRVIPRITGSDIAFTVQVRAEGRVAEELGTATLTDPSAVEAAEAAVAAAIRENLRAVIRREQVDFRSDPYPFGEIIRAHYPALWQQIDWTETFPRVPVDVRVTAFIRRIGERNR